MQQELLEQKNSERPINKSVCKMEKDKHEQLPGSSQGSYTAKRNWKLQQENDDEDDDDSSITSARKKFIQEQIDYYRIKKKRIEFKITILEKQLEDDTLDPLSSGTKKGTHVKHLEYLFPLTPVCSIKRNAVDIQAHEDDRASTVQYEIPKKRWWQHTDKTGDVMESAKIAQQIMLQVQRELTNHCKGPAVPKDFIQYIKTNILKLDTDSKKKTTIGVFGKTGAGKSSLINAVLGEYHLLASGDIDACTSVIIQVEANMKNSKYIAEIEFISKKEWKDELKTLVTVLEEDTDPSDNAVLSTASDKVIALYGDNYPKNLKALMEDMNFSKIPEFLSSSLKTISCENASDLSERIGCYVRHDTSNPGGCYWPVVKCVTIKIPNCKDFLEHISILDLPGTGDYNKSRDEMWKKKLRKCSMIWIVSDIARAGDEKEAWKIFSSSISDMAGGGECSSIAFICTKTDNIIPKDYMRNRKLRDEDLHLTSAVDISKRKSACILHRNNIAKERVKKNFQQNEELKRHFSFDDSCLSVFTVSSSEYFEEDTLLKKEETEIPMLREVLKKCNSRHTNDKASQYINGAIGILSLIQGCKDNDSVEMLKEKQSVHEHLKNTLRSELNLLQEYGNHIYNTLDALLSKGAKESEEKCLDTAKRLTGISPKKSGQGFHRTLSALCNNDGFYRSKSGTKDMNAALTTHMYNSMDKEFKEFFPVQRKAPEKSLSAHIQKFTVVPANLKSKYKKSPLWTHRLKFLQTEEMKVKTKLKQEIVEKKKNIYTSISKTVKSTMQPCYQRAATIFGDGSMKKKQDLLIDHIETSKCQMFQSAKSKMLELIDNMMSSIFTEMKKLSESMEYCVYRLDTALNMDVSDEIEDMEILLNNLSERIESSMQQTEPMMVSEDLSYCSAEQNLEQSGYSGDMHDADTATFPMDLFDTEYCSPQQQFSANAIEFNPEMCGQAYRFLCPHAGLFQCKITSLVFETEEETEVWYHMDSWNTLQISALGDMVPAGPLYDVKCLKGLISHLHLPHCEILLEGNQYAGIHVTINSVEIITPINVTNTHVVIPCQSLSAFGLLKRKIYPPNPIRAQVLLFHKEIRDTQRRTQLLIHLLPDTVKVEAVKRIRQNCEYFETSSGCRLTEGKKYKLCCAPYVPEPEVGEFHPDYDPNIHPTFVVFFDAENITVSLQDENGIEVWGKHQILLPGHNPNARLHRKSKAAEFLDKHMAKIIQKVTSVMELADHLKDRKMISGEMFNEIKAKNTPQCQMRTLSTFFQSTDLKVEVYEFLRRNHFNVINEIEPGHSNF